MNQVPLRVICCDMYFPSGCIGRCFCGTPFPPPLNRRVRPWPVITHTSSEPRNPLQEQHPLFDTACGRMRQKARCALLKEELIAAFWHPRRVEKMLEQGGWELVDSY